MGKTGAKTGAARSGASRAASPDAAGDAVQSWFDAATMGLEANAVIGLRMMKVAGANPFTNPLQASLAVLEMNRMVAEKALTGFQVAARAGLDDPLAPMRAQVSANRRRLSR